MQKDYELNFERPLAFDFAAVGVFFDSRLYTGKYTEEEKEWFFAWFDEVL